MIFSLTINHIFFWENQIQQVYVQNIFLSIKSKNILPEMSQNIYAFSEY